MEIPLRKNRVLTSIVISVFAIPVHRQEKFRQTQAQVGIIAVVRQIIPDVGQIIPAPSRRRVIDIGFGVVLRFDVGFGYGHGRSRRVVVL